MRVALHKLRNSASLARMMSSTYAPWMPINFLSSFLPNISDGSALDGVSPKSLIRCFISVSSNESSESLSPYIGRNSSRHWSMESSNFLAGSSMKMRRISGSIM